MDKEYIDLKKTNIESQEKRFKELLEKNKENGNVDFKNFLDDKKNKKEFINFFNNNVEFNENNFYKIHRHLHENYIAKKVKINLLNPISEKNKKEYKKGYYLFRPFGNNPTDSYFNHIVLIKKTKDGKIKLFDTLNYCKGKAKEEDVKAGKAKKVGDLIFDTERQKNIKEIISKTFNMEQKNIIDVDSDLKSLNQNKTKIKISGKQRSNQGCFEMCLYITRIHILKNRYFNINKDKLKKYQENKEEIKEIINKKIEEFDKIIHLTNTDKDTKGDKKFQKGTKDKEVFNKAVDKINTLRIKTNIDDVDGIFSINNLIKKHKEKNKTTNNIPILANKLKNILLNKGENKQNINKITK